MGDTAMNVPVEVRSHELRQLDKMVPKAADRLREVATENNDLASEADTLDRAYDEHILDMPATHSMGDGYLSMPADDWRAIIRHLPRIEDNVGVTRVWWLRKKLTSRVRERLAELEDSE
jgi:hypothetical protein